MALFVVYPPIPSGAAASNLSVGTNNTTAPGSSTEIAYVNGSGNLTPVSPTNPLPITEAAATDVNVTGSLGALNATVPVATNGAGTAIFELTGTWVGTVTFEGSNDNFVTSQAMIAINLTSGGPYGATATANGFYSVLPQGFAKTQARMSAYTSGSASVNANSSAGTRVFVPVQGVAGNLQMTANQATGTNLHTVVDSGTVTVTQATGTNLHTVVDSGTVVATQATGTNLHTVVDSGTMVVTQPTGTNLHTVVDSGSVSVSNFPSTQATQPVAGLTVTGSVTSATTLFSQDCSQYQSVSLQITSIGVGNTVQFQVSNDNINWINAAMMPAGDLTSILSSSATLVGTYLTQLNSRFFRANVSVYGSGTVACTAYFKAFGNSPNSIGGYVSAQNLDGIGNPITSQSSGSQRALDVGVNVAGVQVDPRAIRALTSTDVVTATYNDLTTSGTISTQNLNPTSGVATALSTVGLTLNGQATITFSTVGVFTGALTPQISMDGTNWNTATNLFRMSNQTVIGTVPNGVQDSYTLPVAGFNMFRMSANAAVTGSVVVAMRASQSTGVSYSGGASTAVTQGGPGTIGNSWYTKISDGANGPAAVKAASTAAVAADPSFVVQLSPNSNALIQPGRGTLTDNSGTTSATPSLATTLMAINAARKYLFIANTSLSNTLWINFTTTAVASQPSIPLLPGAAFVQESGFVSTELVSVVCTVAGSPYTAKQA